MYEHRVAQENDLPAVRRLLADNGLVHEDLVDWDFRKFAILEAGDSPALVAVAGLETFAGCHDGLLRSVAVRPDWRGRGVGASLVGGIETWARESGVRKLWLLTTTAPDFFLGLYYQKTERESAPASVQQSAEFCSLCPASAVCLSKIL